MSAPPTPELAIHRPMDPTGGLSEPERAADVQASFCATVVDEWVRAGLTHAVVSPGSRSTPLALAIAGSALVMLVVLDERSAAFIALGIGRATGRPTVLVCTSGTAAVEYHPAVAEADLDRVPMLVCTADRPAELHAIGAPQTVDQAHLFGRSVRWFFSPGVASAANRHAWRSIAARAAIEASQGGDGPGPVHLNLAFREPLIGVATDIPAGRAAGAPWHRAPAFRSTLDDDGVADLAALFEGRRGVVLAGAGSGDPEAVHLLADTLGWPVIADVRSLCRLPGPSTVGAADAFLRDPETAAALRPEVVLRLGAPWASKVVGEWAAGAELDVLVDPFGAWLDPRRTAAIGVRADPAWLCRALLGAVRAGADVAWRTMWEAVEGAAQHVLAHRLEESAADADRCARKGDEHLAMSEPQIARAVLAAVPDGGHLVVSSSMPVRDIEWFGGARDGVTVHANRGANGIDGVVSTILGVAAASTRPTVGLLGDLAFLHDAGALVTAANGRISATLIVVDNGGGGIFEFLPQASSLPRDDFELLFGTPQPVDPLAVAQGYGVRSVAVGSVRSLREAVAVGIVTAGVTVIVVATDRQHNVAVHDALHREVAAAVRDARNDRQSDTVAR